MDVFVQDRPWDGRPDTEFGNLSFGQDNQLYVSGGKGVLRFDGTTGSFIDTLIPSDSLDNVSSRRFLDFGPDGYLYLIDGGFPGRILRFDGPAGEFISDFVSHGSGGLYNPTSFVFREN